MEYEIRLEAGINVLDEDLVFEHAVQALNCLGRLTSATKGRRVTILRDGSEITMRDLELDASREEDEGRLPSSARTGWVDHYDVTSGPGWDSKRVWKPDNPEDRFED
jgi:hypothetical protein